MKDKTVLSIDVNVDEYCDMVIMIIKLKAHIISLEKQLAKAKEIIKKQHKELVK